MPYWVKLKNDKPFCLVVGNDRITKMMKKHTTVDEKTRVQKLDYNAYHAEMEQYVKKAASQYGEVTSIGTLPYAANPVRSDKKGEPCHEWTMCYDPENCCGRSACPKSRSCSE